MLEKQITSQRSGVAAYIVGWSTRWFSVLSVPLCGTLVGGYGPVNARGIGRCGSLFVFEGKKLVAVWKRETGRCWE